MGSALFVRGQYMADAVLILIKRVVQIQHGAARIPEYGVNSLLEEAFHHDFGTV